MRKLFCVFFLLGVSGLAQSQSSAIIVKYDSVSNFKGDLPVGVFKRGNDITMLKIKTNDSTFLYKEYSKNKLMTSYECDLAGYRNGYSYYLDTINNNVTRSFNSKGRYVFSYTTTPNLDTVAYTRKINDTLYECMEIRGETKTIWQLNYNLINNGFYKVFNLETNKITTEGHYMAIKESELIDKKKYSSLLKKYNIAYMFRSGGMEDEMEAEIPVGVWYYYDKNGKLLKTKEYDWEGIF